MTLELKEFAAALHGLLATPIRAKCDSDARHDAFCNGLELDRRLHPDIWCKHTAVLQPASTEAGCYRVPNLAFGRLSIPTYSGYSARFDQKYLNVNIGRDLKKSVKGASEDQPRSA